MAEETVQDRAPAAGDTATAESGAILTPEAAENAAAQPEAGAGAGAETPKKEEPADKPLLNPDEKEETAEEEANAGAPEAYETFTMPEGYTLEGELAEEVHGLFKELNLSQKNAQKLVDYFTKRDLDRREGELNALAEKRRAWRAELRQRPGFAAERALAQKGMRAVVQTPEEAELFRDSWLSDHPLIFGLFAKIGRLVAEDSFDGKPHAEPEDPILKRFPVKL